jgi:hypothetical protein
VVYVDYATQRRIVKDSGHWYQQLIAELSGALPVKAQTLAGNRPFSLTPESDPSR